MQIFSLATRQRQDEWMDAPDVDPEMIRRSLEFIRSVNSLFGYTRATLGHLAAFSRRWKAGERITVLDVATGSGDIPLAVEAWGRQAGFDLKVVGLDRHHLTAGIAKSEAKQNPNIQIILGDALELPFADASIDYVMTNMFLHHLDDSVVVSVLREMNRVARRGIIAADLLRHRRAYAWVSILTLFSNPMVRHDARVSVAQAFNKAEVMAMRKQADIEYTTYFRHFAHRFILAGEKG